MAGSDTTSLAVATRPVEGSRATRRLRRRGLVPGVLYGGEGEPRAFEVEAKLLRQTLQHAGAVLDLAIDGGSSEPVIVKDVQRHPVRGETTHIDLLRVNLRKPIQATVALELVGGDEAPGVKEGGVLTQDTREVNVEALPTDLPESISHDVSALQINETVTLAAVAAPTGVTFLDDLEETVIASVTPPTLEPVEDEIETETEVVGEADAAGEESEASSDDASSDDA